MSFDYILRCVIFVVKIFLDMGVKILKWMINVFKRCFGYFYLFCIVVRREHDIFYGN